VLAVQNNTSQADMGAASSVVAFFRSLGGSVGVSALGAVLSHQVSAKLGGGQQSHTIPDLDTLPAPLRAAVEQAFGEATGHLFLVAAPFAVAAFLCVLFIREVPLRTTIELAEEIAPEATVGQR
jgi:hypothetical protein